MKALLVVAGYALVAWLSLGFAELQPNTSPVWPPAGLAMAVLFWLGSRYAPTISVGAWVVNFLILLRAAPERPLAAGLAAAGIALGNTGEALLATWMLRKRAGGREFNHTARGAASFLFFVAFLPPWISATVGVASLTAASFVGGGNVGGGNVVLLVITWVIGNAGGLLIFGPLALIRWGETSFRWDRRRIWEVVGLSGALFLIANVMTGIYLGPLLREWPREYMVLPIILWAVFRFREQGTAIALCLLSIFALRGALQGRAVFPAELPGHALIYLQLFLVIVASMAWLVCGKVVELVRMNTSLEEIVTSRIVEQRRLLHEREQSLAIAAHDLRVPLVGIRNLLQLVLKHHPGEAAESGFIRQAIDAATQANTLAVRLLDPPGIQRLEPVAQPTDWVELVAKVAEGARLVGKARGLSVRFQSDAAELRGSLDQTHLLQVLENLTQNALKFSPDESEIAITLTTAAGGVVITISDHGPGIPRKNLPGLFNTVGLARRIRPSADSSGIGLFIVGKLVRQLGGAISCDSTLGQGTTFTLRLPLEAPVAHRKSS